MNHASPLTDATKILGALTLRIRAARGAPRLVDLTSNECRIGAALGCTLRLKAPGVRDLHCVILRSRGGSVVRRLADDTCLNGAPFVETSLKAGDCLSIGPLKVDVVADDCAGSALEGPEFVGRIDQQLALLELQLAELAAGRQIAAPLPGVQESVVALTKRLDSLEQRTEQESGQSAQFAERPSRLENQTSEFANICERCRAEYPALELGQEKHRTWRQEFDAAIESRIDALEMRAKETADANTAWKTMRESTQLSESRWSQLESQWLARIEKTEADLAELVRQQETLRDARNSDGKAAGQRQAEFTGGLDQLARAMDDIRVERQELSDKINGWKTESDEASSLVERRLEQFDGRLRERMPEERQSQEARSESLHAEWIARIEKSEADLAELTRRQDSFSGETTTDRQAVDQEQREFSTRLDRVVDAMGKIRSQRQEFVDKVDAWKIQNHETSARVEQRLEQFDGRLQEGMSHEQQQREAQLESLNANWTARIEKSEADLAELGRKLESKLESLENGGNSREQADSPEQAELIERLDGLASDIDELRIAKLELAENIIGWKTQNQEASANVETQLGQFDRRLHEGLSEGQQRAKTQLESLNAKWAARIEKSEADLAKLGGKLESKLELLHDDGNSRVQADNPEQAELIGRLDELASDIDELRIAKLELAENITGWKTQNQEASANAEARLESLHAEWLPRFEKSESDLAELGRTLISLHDRVGGPEQAELAERLDRLSSNVDDLRIERKELADQLENWKARGAGELELVGERLAELDLRFEDLAVKARGSLGHETDHSATSREFEDPNHRDGVFESGRFSPQHSATPTSVFEPNASSDDPRAAKEPTLMSEAPLTSAEPLGPFDRDDATDYPDEDMEQENRAVPGAEGLEFHSPQSQPSDCVFTPPASAEEEENLSIEQYMEGLLNRSRSGDEYAKPIPEYSVSSGTDETPPSAIEQNAGNPIPPHVPAEHEKATNSADFMPRVRAPESVTGLSAMRALANKSARKAIDAHSRKGQAVIIRGAPIVAAVALAAAIILMILAPSWLDVGAVIPWAILLALFIAVFWTGRYVILRCRLADKDEEEDTPGRASKLTQAKPDPMAAESESP